MEHHSAVLPRRLDPYCARTLEGMVPFPQPRVYAETLSEHWLLTLPGQGLGVGGCHPGRQLNPQILPVIGQQLLSHMAAKHKPSSALRIRDDVPGIVLAFDEQAEGEML